MMLAQHRLSITGLQVICWTNDLKHELIENNKKPKVIIKAADSSVTDKSLCENKISMTYVY